MSQCKCRFNNLILGVWCVTKCGCHSMHLHFNLQPLPIMGLGYWWNLDFGDSLSLIMWDNWYFLVIIKHFLKWLKLVPLLDHSNKGRVKHGRTMHNYAPCHLPNVDGQIYSFFLLLSLLAYDVCCDGNFQVQTLCWFKVEVLMDGIWDVLHLYWRKYWSKHGFFLGAQNKLEYLCN